MVEDSAIRSMQLVISPSYNVHLLLIIIVFVDMLKEHTQRRSDYLGDYIACEQRAYRPLGLWLLETKLSWVVSSAFPRSAGTCT